jgi:hypothetical protein
MLDKDMSHANRQSNRNAQRDLEKQWYQIVGNGVDGQGYNAKDARNEAYDCTEPPFHHGEDSADAETHKVQERRKLQRFFQVGQ